MGNTPDLRVYTIASLLIRREELGTDARRQIIGYASLLAAQKAGHVCLDGGFSWERRTHSLQRPKSEARDRIVRRSRCLQLGVLLLGSFHGGVGSSWLCKAAPPNTSCAKHEYSNEVVLEADMFRESDGAA